jgi:exodeoxyribonuclease VII small subunit
MSFEKQLARLEAIVGELEAEEVDLSRALALFEEGVQCLRAASTDLTAAEARVRSLVERADGSFDLTELRGRGS